jgi:hypothetical protein
VTTDTAKLRSLLAARTSGRWSWDKVAREIRNEHGDEVVSAYPTHGIEPGDNGASIDIKYTDLELIIEAVNALEPLLDEREQLRRALVDALSLAPDNRERRAQLYLIAHRPCEECGEETLNDTLCRDCDITRNLDSMQCSVCKRMRYRLDDDTAPCPGLGRALWGDRCECDPRPPSVYEARVKPP